MIQIATKNIFIIIFGIMVFGFVVILNNLKSTTKQRNTSNLIKSKPHLTFLSYQVYDIKKNFFSIQCMKNQLIYVDNKSCVVNVGMPNINNEKGSVTVSIITNNKNTYFQYEYKFEKNNLNNIQMFCDNANYEIQNYIINYLKK